MGKKKKAVEAAPLSKKERKAAEARAAEIAAELARREAKKTKKAKGKKNSVTPSDESRAERRATADKKADKADKKSAKKAVAASEASNAKATKKAKKGKSSVPEPVREEKPDAASVEAETIAAARAERKAKKAAAREDMEAGERAALGGETLPEHLESRTDLTKKEKKKLLSNRKEAIDADLPTRGEIIEAADKVLASADSSDGAKAAATTAKAAATEADPDESTASIRERVQRKAAERKELEALAPTIDRSDAEAVRAYNKRAGKLGLLLLTSDEEREKVAARDDVLEHATAAVEAIRHEVEAVETEHGREFAAGPATEDFAQPSEAPRADFEVNGLGQYKVKRPSDGKMVGYTRVTPYIDAIEDSSRLVAWKLRTLLEGVALAAEPGEREDAISALRDLTHRRDMTIAKARKKDRKGELEPGELAQRVSAAEKDFKKAVDALADELLDLGGAKDKANKGTNLHALFEIVDDPKRGLPEIHRMRQEDVITPADVRDCMAWADAMATLGAKVIDVERVIVNDAVPVPRFLPEAEYGGKPPKTIGVAGRLDRTAMIKLPGRQRAGRYVVDAKTGTTLEYSAGKVARQLTMYANAQGYDLDTHEREDLKLDKKTGIVIHVPAGSGKAHVYLVDLTLGAKGNKVAADVRAMRNEGKKAIDLGTDLLEIIRAEEASAKESDS